jgi:hypothetical protein
VVGGGVFGRGRVTVATARVVDVSGGRVSVVVLGTVGADRGVVVVSTAALSSAGLVRRD